MRFLLILLLLLSPALSSATLKTVTDLMNEAKENRAEISPQNSLEEKLKKLRQFENSLSSTLKGYIKASAQEGGEAEEKVAKFSYRFEVLFKLSRQKQINPEACKKSRHQIEFEDKSGKSEDAKLSEAAEEALQWLDLICDGLK
ncbi:MAG: hypothetical protein ACXWRE_09690 [Pseudobdellovibrionaceae bacterium]